MFKVVQGNVQGDVQGKSRINTELFKVEKVISTSFIFRNKKNISMIEILI
jgi:hypothetical protein